MHRPGATLRPPLTALIGGDSGHLRDGDNVGAVEQDAGSPIEEVREGMKTIARGYQEAGAPERFSYWIEKGVGHVLSEEMYRRTRKWFQQHLRDA